MVEVLLSVLPFSEIGFSGGDFRLFGREIVGFADAEQRIVGISSFVIGENDECFIEFSESFVISFWDESSGECCVRIANGLFCGSVVNFKHAIVVNSVSSDGGGKRIFLCESGYSFENVCKHVALW